MPSDAGSPARLTSIMLIGALRRRVAAEGGFVTILAKGDDISGVILVQTLDRGRAGGLFERVPNFDGSYALMRCGPAEKDGPGALDDYVRRRRRSDPDLWLIELDVPDGERFAAETIC